MKDYNIRQYINNQKDIFAIVLDDISNAKTVYSFVVDMEEYDGKESMAMWIQILKKYEDYLQNSNCVNYIILNVFEDIIKKYTRDSQDSISCIFMEHIVTNISQNPELLEYIYQKAGIVCDLVNKAYLPFCLAHLILNDDISAVSHVVKCISQNRYMENRIGYFYYKVYEMLAQMKDTDRYDCYFKRFCISNEIKKVLWNNINLIKNQKEHAESQIAILAIIDL